MSLLELTFTKTVQVDLNALYPRFTKEERELVDEAVQRLLLNPPTVTTSATPYVKKAGMKRSRNLPHGTHVKLVPGWRSQKHDSKVQALYDDLARVGIDDDTYDGVGLLCKRLDIKARRSRDGKTFTNLLRSRGLRDYTP